MQFTLTIELGNDGMQLPADVGHALEYRVVPWLIGAGNVPFAGGETGRIRDANGNTVGKWEVRDAPVRLTNAERYGRDGSRAFGLDPSALADDL